MIGLLEQRENQLVVLPLEGVYYPRVGDLVIGLVEDVELYGWNVDIVSPYIAYLQGSSVLGRPVNSGEDLRRYLNVGDYVMAKVESFDRSSNPILTVKGKGLGRISKGTVVDVSPVRTPRLIGRNRSMVETLSSETGCEVVVGQNGRVWMNCSSKETEDLLVEMIYLIEREPYTKGLTEKVKSLIRDRLGVNVAGPEAKANP
ncbi:RNA-binding protein [Sulfodiicoccus acidiphilus]|uniref:RNA-binding protein n=1 Tax=Sulfodiicoccus acidiphilus TaxID=1670455 RepID=A0A348B127_9CREN|nr:RNA-binding protein [Sulfodiicoccus acidiphilus]GGT91161.1 RNA-binding protein [Sulfodiicoccus acidiphilus]